MKRIAQHARRWIAFMVVVTAFACGAEPESPSATDKTTQATGATSSMSAAAGARAPASTSAVAGSSAGAAAAKPSSTAGSPAAPSGGAPAGGSAAAAIGGMAGSPAAVSGGTGGAGGAGGSSSASMSGTDTGGIPCDAFKALANACHRCHGAVPLNGAPMSLVKLEDFQVLTVQTPKIPKYQQARERIDGTKNPRMPPMGSPITDEDKQTLIDWLGKGAPAAEGDTNSCP